MGKRSVLRSFKPVFWLVIVFEFFERGSYYGVMSILSVYLTDILHIAKEDVGLIKSTIQPLLYFLPIITGALADRFGYRKTLLAAFTLLGTGYALTSQMTTYGGVFLALCIMGLGAGAFKPIISGTIARTTDSSNSTVGFGIYYWSINLGAFLFPLVLVPLLKNTIGWEWVMVAAALGTGSMILPTLFLYREPVAEVKEITTKNASLVQTLADAFEIIYSPIILVVQASKKRRGVAVIALLLGVLVLGAAVYSYFAPRKVTVAVIGKSFQLGDRILEVSVQRNMTSPQPWKVERNVGDPPHIRLVVHKPDEVKAEYEDILSKLGFSRLDVKELDSMVKAASKPIRLTVRAGKVGVEAPYAVKRVTEDSVLVMVQNAAVWTMEKEDILSELRSLPHLGVLPEELMEDLFSRVSKRSFLLGFISLVLLVATVIIFLQPHYRGAGPVGRAFFLIGTLAVGVALLWFLPGLSLFARIVSSVVYVTVLSLYLMDFSNLQRFRDHWRFLLLIFLYSGFWVLYFQMFDSVLWYVQAYVDASSLNQFVNGVLSSLGIGFAWRFDVEHVTVINAGTIILLQLLVSSIVRKTKALPTMIVGIAMGTLGMAMLALSEGIWVFIAGIVIFSIGEMTAHPKFISYVGQTAPRDKVATYMGYIFLYGVIGSSIGGVLGAKLYVHWVDQLNRPRVLWLIFASIGVVTIASLLLYSRFLHRDDTPT